MAKKRVQVGEFQKRAQLQAPARVVDQYVSPVSRQSQVAEALSSVVPALQKYQEKELESRIDKMEGELLEKINKGEYKDVLKDYRTYTEENNVIYNTYAKKRYEQILAPQAAMQVGLKLREAYNKSEYRKSTNPTDFNKFLQENIGNFTREYENLFTANGGGIKSFNQALSPEINKIEQYFVENASANNYREELQAYKVQLNNVTTDEQYTEFVNNTKGTFLSNKDRDEAILAWASQGIDIPIDGEFTSRNFDLIKDKQVGNTGQTYGQRYKELAEKSSPDMLEVAQLAYNEKIRGAEETKRKNFINDTLEQVSPQLTAAYKSNDFDEVDKIIAENFSHPLMSEHHMQELRDEIDTNFNLARVQRETSLEARQTYMSNIIANVSLDSKDIANDLRTYVLSQKNNLTPAGYKLLQEVEEEYLDYPFNLTALVDTTQGALGLPLGKEGIVYKAMEAVRQDLLSKPNKEEFRNMGVREAYETYRTMIAGYTFRTDGGKLLKLNTIPTYEEIGETKTGAGDNNQRITESTDRYDLKKYSSNIGRAAAQTNQGTNNE
jgi:hypothetical protein